MRLSGQLKCAVRFEYLVHLEIAISSVRKARDALCICAPDLYLGILR